MSSCSPDDLFPAARDKEADSPCAKLAPRADTLETRARLFLDRKSPRHTSLSIHGELHRLPRSGRPKRHFCPSGAPFWRRSCLTSFFSSLPWLLCTKSMPWELVTKVHSDRGRKAMETLGNPLARFRKAGRACRGRGLVDPFCQRQSLTAELCAEGRSSSANLLMSRVLLSFDSFDEARQSRQLRERDLGIKSKASTTIPSEHRPMCASIVH
jgi:hypothetical protein